MARRHPHGGCTRETLASHDAVLAPTSLASRVAHIVDTDSHVEISRRLVVRIHERVPGSPDIPSGFGNRCVAVAAVVHDSVIGPYGWTSRMFDEIGGVKHALPATGPDVLDHAPLVRNDRQRANINCSHRGNRLGHGQHVARVATARSLERDGRRRCRGLDAQRLLTVRTGDGVVGRGSGKTGAYTDKHSQNGHQKASSIEGQHERSPGNSKQIAPGDRGAQNPNSSVSFNDPRRRRPTQLRSRGLFRPDRLPCRLDCSQENLATK